MKTIDHRRAPVSFTTSACWLFTVMHMYPTQNRSCYRARPTILSIGKQPLLQKQNIYMKLLPLGNQQPDSRISPSWQLCNRSFLSILPPTDDTAGTKKQIMQNSLSLFSTKSLVTVHCQFSSKSNQTSTATEKLRRPWYPSI